MNINNYVRNEGFDTWAKSTINYQITILNIHYYLHSTIKQFALCAFTAVVRLISSWGGGSYKTTFMTQIEAYQTTFQITDLPETF